MSTFLNHLRTMALFGVDLDDVDIELSVQMAYAGPAHMVYSVDGHEFVVAPRSIIFRRKRVDGGRDLLLRYEHSLPPASPEEDHMSALRWIYAGPAGVFSPAQIGQIWDGIKAYYASIAGNELPYRRNFLERFPDEIFQREMATKVSINLGHLIRYAKLEDAIFELQIDGEPHEDLLFKRLQLQAVYQRFPCTEEELFRLIDVWKTDPVRVAMPRFDAYYEFYARSRELLDKSSADARFLESVSSRFASAIVTAHQAGMAADLIVQQLIRNLAIHSLHEGAAHELVRSVLVDEIPSQANEQRLTESQRA